MQFQVCESDDSCQPGAQYTNPPVVVQEHHGAPLLNCSGLVLVRQLIERLGVARAIDAGVRVLRRCKWYRESDHILTLIFSMFSGGNKLQDVNRLGQDDALKRVLGSDRIPHATTIGKFLWRFGNDQHDKQRQGLAELRDTTAAIQQDAFAMLPRERRKVATLDWDSSIHEVYGQKKEGADFAYDNTWSYSALYGIPVLLRPNRFRPLSRISPRFLMAGRGWCPRCRGRGPGCGRGGGRGARWWRRCRRRASRCPVRAADWCPRRCRSGSG